MVPLANEWQLMIIRCMFQALYMYKYLSELSLWELTFRMLLFKCGDHYTNKVLDAIKISPLSGHYICRSENFYVDSISLESL